MLVGGDVLAKKQKAGIAIPTGNIRQDLVIGPVFLHNIKYMFDGRRIANLHGYRVSGLSGGKGFFFFCIGCVGIYRFGKGGKLSRCRLLKNTHRALEETANVLHILGFGGIPFLVNDLLFFFYRIRTIGIGHGGKSFAIGHKNLLAKNAHIGGIPTNGDKAHGTAVASMFHIKNGQTIVVCIGNIKALFIRRQGKTIGSRAAWCVRVKGSVQCFGYFHGCSADHRHGIIVGIGNKEPVSFF